MLQSASQLHPHNRTQRFYRDLPILPCDTRDIIAVCVVTNTENNVVVDVAANNAPEEDLDVAVVAERVAVYLIQSLGLATRLPDNANHGTNELQIRFVQPF